MQVNLQILHQPQPLLRKKGLQSLHQTSSLFKGTRLNLLRGKTALRKGFSKIHRACAPTG